MLRYYLIATLIVVTLGALVFAHRLAPPDLRISAEPTGTPTVESSAPPDGAPGPAEFAGTGTWVLSALPACFDERSRTRGTARALAPKLPPAAARIAPGTALRAGVCRLFVRSHDLLVTRGSDRLRVPPEARLYRDDDVLVLVTGTPATVEIRRYIARQGRFP